MRVSEFLLYFILILTAAFISVTNNDSMPAVVGSLTFIIVLFLWIAIRNRRS